MPLADLSRLMSRGPAEILGLNKGLIAEGYDGDVVLVGGRALHRAPGGFCGQEQKHHTTLSLYGRVACTVKAGRVTYDNGSNRINTQQRTLCCGRLFV
ncbi:MAG: amidohydrolase family protein [Ruthenibacterium lactatiformans]